MRTKSETDAKAKYILRDNETYRGTWHELEQDDCDDLETDYNVIDHISRYQAIGIEAMY